MRLFCVMLFFFLFFLTNSCNAPISDTEGRMEKAALTSSSGNQPCDRQAAYEAFVAYQQCLKKERRIQMEHYQCDRTTWEENEALWKKSWKAKGETRRRHQELIAIIGGTEGEPLRCPEYQQYLPDTSRFYYTEEVYQPQDGPW